jgi:uncharacterized membrane protein YvbJ
MALIQCTECGKNISDTTDECIHCGIRIKNDKFDEINQSDLINEFELHHRSRESNESDTKINISEIVASGLKPILEAIFVFLLIIGLIFIWVYTEYETLTKITAIVIYYSILVLTFGLTFLIINTSKTIYEINILLEDILNRIK